MENVVSTHPKQEQWHNVRTCNLPALEAYITKLNKRAAKLELQPIFVQQGEPYLYRYFVEVGGRNVEYLEPFTPVRIHGVSPIIAGWKFVATITLEDTVNVLRIVPEFEQKLPAEFRTVSPSRCDHCHMSRNRNESFIVQNAETFEYRVVGRNCLRDFLGHKSPEALAALLSIFSDADTFGCADEDGDGFGGFGSSPTVFALKRVVAVAQYLIEKDGFTSAAQARVMGVSSTGMNVRHFLTANSARMNDAERKAHEEFNARMDSDATFVQTIDKVIEHFSAEPDSKDSDYRWNLYALTANYAVRVDQVGIAASMYVAYVRDMEREVKRQYERKQAAVSEWVGTEKKREVFTLTVTGIRHISGIYGMTTLVMMRDNAGNIVKWFATGHRNYEPGQTLTGKGTVKKHETYEGSKQTLLTRCDFEVVKTEAVVAA